VVLIKLADRLTHAHADALPPPRRLRMARETLDIFAPLAHRLGMASEVELEDLAFSHLNPTDTPMSSKLIRRKRKEREAFVAEVTESPGARVGAVGISSRSAAPQAPYSIWRKMDEAAGLRRIYDLIAIRVGSRFDQGLLRRAGVIHSSGSRCPGASRLTSHGPSQRLPVTATTIVAHSGRADGDPDPAPTMQPHRRVRGGALDI